MSRVAVVTGGASGMGLAIARRLAAQGDRVGIFDINGDAAEQAAADIRAEGGQAIGCAVDVADRSSVDAALDAVRAEFGPVLVMVTSAGIAPFEKFLDISLESWERTIEVNLTGTFHCLQAAIPDMVAAGWGRIVTISSSSAQQGAPRMGHYSASKGGVIALTRSLAKEFGTKGITVNTIPPSMIDTPMSRQSQEVGNLPDTEFLAARIPVGRVGTGDDIAAAAVFLCSNDAGYITGQTFGVNGGAVV
ncbi:MAG: SDR family NAD(P)-dependent oxidoreductase [Acidimicrobiia bacterium]